jgi:hypothetical protein
MILSDIARGHKRLEWFRRRRRAEETDELQSDGERGLAGGRRTIELMS